MKRILRLVLPAFFAVGLIVGMPGAANADPGAVVLTGTANTDNLGLPGSSCTDNGTGGAGTCHWEITLLPANCTGTDCSGLPVTFTGKLGSVGGVGPACGVSSGTQTVGEVKTAFGHDISKLRWTSSAGSVFPVTGDAVHPITGQTSAVVVLVRVNPTNPTACASGTAGSFTVNAVATVTP